MSVVFCCCCCCIIINDLSKCKGQAIMKESGWLMLRRLLDMMYIYGHFMEQDHYIHVRQNSSINKLIRTYTG